VSGETTRVGLRRFHTTQLVKLGRVLPPVPTKGAPAPLNSVPMGTNGGQRHNFEVVFNASHNIFGRTPRRARVVNGGTVAMHGEAREFHCTTGGDPHLLPSNRPALGLYMSNVMQCRAAGRASMDFMHSLRPKARPMGRFSCRVGPSSMAFFSYCASPRPV